MTLKQIFIFLFFLVPVHLSFSETIFLKNGTKISGEMIEETNEYVRINFKGVILKYYRDDIYDISQTDQQIKEVLNVKAPETQFFENKRKERQILRFFKVMDNSYQFMIDLDKVIVATKTKAVNSNYRHQQFEQLRQRMDQLVRFEISKKPESFEKKYRVLATQALNYGLDAINMAKKGSNPLLVSKIKRYLEFYGKMLRLMKKEFKEFNEGKKDLRFIDAQLDKLKKLENIYTSRKGKLTATRNK
ncbi:MAG: hypothetical protein PHV17_01800 [Candidatus Omnitrophica bacterium]|nr:hypothetical protein [Candidatus Omnitrophota bacterium]